MSEDLIYKSFELAAEKGEDISDSVYEKYYRICPDSKDLMAYVDERVKAKMMEEVYRLVMVEDFAEETGYLNWEVDNHEMAYSVLPHMYDGLFAALIVTVSETLGDDWSEEYASAWQSRTDQLNQEILARFSKAP